MVQPDYEEPSTDIGILPGSWPETPIHKRTRTYPLAPHHERVMQLQQQLAMSMHRTPSKATEEAQAEAVGTLPESVSSGERIGSSLPSSEGSNLTRFTQSNSANADASSPSSLGSSQGVRFEEKATSHLFPLPVETQKRIHERISIVATDDPHQAVDASGSLNAQSIHLPLAHSAQHSIIAGVASASPSPYSSRFTLSRSSTGGSELSSIVFRSPTSSNRPSHLRITPNDSYDNTSSWLTSDNGEYDDSRLLRIGTPSPTPSPSPSPLSTRDFRRQQALSVPVISSSRLPSTSAEELQLSSHPMLTNMSLPGSLNNSVISLEVPVPSRPSTSVVGSEGHPCLTPASEDTGLILSSGSSESTSLSLSLSPSSSLRARLEIPARLDAVRFPTSSSSPSSSIPTSSPQTLPSPIAPLPDERELRSAVEYANAVVMSSWGNDNDFMEPIAILSTTQNPVVNESVVTDVPRIHVQTEPTIEHAIEPAARPSQDPSRPTPGMLFRMKKLGLKIKKILFRRTTTLKQEVTEDVAQDNLDVLDIRGDSNVSQILPQLEQQFGRLDGRERSAPSGPVQNRVRRPRPSLTPETYTPMSNEDPFQNLSAINQEMAEQNAPQTSAVSEEATSPNFRRQLEAHARPKTVDEIRAKRPFSLPGLSSRSSRGRSTPIPVNLNRRHRPISALVLPTRPYPYGSSPVQNDGSFPNRIVLPSRRHSGVPPPPGLRSPSNSASYASPMTSGFSSSTSRQTANPADSETKKTRRVSLAALSSFAAGLRNQGTWARYSESRRN
ncbi:hypothetical protein VNI00_001542 [Paramarasmius palmivorus]|uniref:Uncharacterized protein n=1 Tax=Paramarasmius palmivorus TaxID=297713 RepID=A0AAW0E0V8_9AGAR